MKGVVVFDSVHGNSRAVAEAIAEQIEADGHDARLVNLSSDPSGPLSGEFMFIGSPTRYATMTGHTKKFLKKLDLASWGSKPIAVFETYGPVEPGKLAESKADEKWVAAGAAKKMHDMMKERGFNVRWPGLRLAVTGRKGPLAPGEIDEAKSYAHCFMESLTRSSD